MVIVCLVWERFVPACLFVSGKEFAWLLASCDISLTSCMWASTLCFFVCFRWCLVRAFVPCSVLQYIYYYNNFICFRVCFSQCLPFNGIGLCLFCVLVACSVAASEAMLLFIFGSLLLFMWDGIYVLWFCLLSRCVTFFFNCIALPVYCLFLLSCLQICYFL